MTTFEEFHEIFDGNEDDYEESVEPVKSGAKVSKPKAFNMKRTADEVWDWSLKQAEDDRDHDHLYYIDEFLDCVLGDDYDDFIKYVAADEVERLAKKRANKLAEKRARELAEDIAKSRAEEMADGLAEERAEKIAEKRAVELAEIRAKGLADELVKKTIKEKLERGELILPSSQAANGASDALLSDPGADTLPKRSKAAKERTREIVSERKTEHRKKLVAAFEQMVPKEYLNYPYDEYIVGDKSDLPRGIQRDIRKFVKDAKDSRESLKTDAYQMAVVSGRKNGTGKTTTAIAIAREIVSQSLCSGAYVYASDALSRASYMYDEVVQELVSPRVLVIDDVGVSKADMSDRQRDAFHYIIDQRWADPNKITIITTNLPFTSTEIETGLSGYVGRALWSRISDRLLMIEQNNTTHRGSGRGDDEDDE